MTNEKNVKYYDNLAVASSPHLVTALDTPKTMMWVLIALIPSFIASVFYFGAGAVILTVVCAACSMFFEWGYERLLGKKVTVKDLSACVTGVILAMNLPANLPVWMAVIGCFVAIVIVKQLYGGLGRNFANPAIVGRIVLLLSFTSYMTTWPVTRLNQTADALTGATPLGLLADGALAEAPSLKDMFLGNIGGAMGETCTIAILIGLVILIAKKIISPIIPCFYIGTVFVFSLIYYSVTGGDYSALHMALFHTLAGGVVFGATFCATDYVTSPIMKYAKVAYGIGCGLVTMIIRLFCAYPEGASFAILFMNVMTPLLDMVAQNYFYGIGAAEKAAKKAAKEAGKEAAK
jgi:electron transport complex protein RnfD